MFDRTNRVATNSERLSPDHDFTMFYTELFFLGDKPLGYCVYEVSDVNNAKSIDGIKATIRVEKDRK